MGERSILTNLRLPASLDARVRAVARRTGVSRNDLIKVIVASALATASNPPQTPLTSEQLDAATRAVAALIQPAASQEDKQ
jgi:Ribbon-helix-helix protein, copG family